MKKCFVIMPYGGTDEKAQRLYTGVYQTIVATAARNAGYEPKRSDIAGEPGNVTHDIIRDLAEAEIVVADLTSGNPNVFFELGIRHAFRKSGTVHIVNADQDLPFDVRHYRVIKYSPNELAAIPDVIRTIEEAIRKREHQPDRPDNPVHDALPELPIDIRASGDIALLDQLRRAQENLESLRQENDKLSSELAKLKPAKLDAYDVDIDALFAKADEAMKSKGEFGTLRLRQAMKDGGPEEFVTELRKVLKSPYLEPNDFMAIVNICKQAALDVHRRATLEVAHQRFPQEEQIFFAFIDALDDSPNPDDRLRGQTMLERFMKIEYRNGLPSVMSAEVYHDLATPLALLFNFYNRIRKSEWILALIDSLPQRWAEDSMVLCNRALSLERLGNIAEAEVIYKKAIELHPKNDQGYLWYSAFLDRQGRDHECYENDEKAIYADPSDAKLYMHLAIDILNNGYHRRLSDGMILGPEDRKLRAKYALPLFVRAIEIGGSAELLQKIVSVLVRMDAVAEAEAIASGRVPSGSYDTDPLLWLTQQEIPSSIVTPSSDQTVQLSAESAPRTPKRIGSSKKKFLRA